MKGTQDYRDFIKPYPKRMAQLMITGKVVVGWSEREDPESRTTLYAFRCGKHGVFAAGHKSSCPKCQ